MNVVPGLYQNAPMINFLVCQVIVSFLFFLFFLISLTSSVFLSKIIIMNFHIDFLTELQARKGLIFLKSIFGL